MRIKILSDQIINQIAAGEVIENPASVVKELVENALDAGATDIKIETKGGGLQLIRVMDNGCGMEPDDALLSLERHATSKISSADDLFALHTMGFRGEALASIAAISKLTLITAEKMGATQVEVEGGKILKIGPSARTQGTTLEIRSLFFNVPARKKFQKAAALCANEVARVVGGISLAYPEIGFELVQQDVPALVASKSSQLLQRIAEVLGERFCQELLPVDLEEENVKITGYIGAPTTTRHNRTGQHLYINKRAVVSPWIALAVRDGYATRLATDRHPVFVLHIQITPHLVDVNVHPQKREVRMREEDVLKTLIKKAVLRALEGGKEERTFDQRLPEIPSFTFREPVSEPFEQPLVFREEEEIYELPVKYTVRVLGVYSHFLFLEDKEFILVDLLAARARIAFEQFFKEKKIQAQGLLIPITIQLSAMEAGLIEMHREEIEALGIHIRSLGGHAFIIDALPSFLEPSGLEEVLLKITEELRKDVHGERLEKLALIATQHAQRGQFSSYEAELIYKELLLTSSPRFAPDGRKTMRTLNKEDLLTILKN